ncbi:acetylglutamate kinase [bacterium]|nr:acetylglutamate kinase [bacterium]
MKELIKKADILLESLPYIKEFAGRTIVIKYGGSAMVSENLRSNFARDIILLRYVGIKPVVVHGGGPQIGKTLEKMGKKTRFVRGHRVTDDETMDVVEMVLGGKVNKEIVTLIQKHGGKAVGLTGKDGGLFFAEKLLIEESTEGDGPPEIIDPGKVGRITSVHPEVIHRLDEGNFIPVIAPVGVDADGNTYNINADSVAGAIAAALKAEKLLLMTDVPGITDEKGDLVSSLDRKALDQMVASGVVHGGMIPKVDAATFSIEEGVSKVHIVDGRVDHAVLLEIFTQTGIGTEIVP